MARIANTDSAYCQVFYASAPPVESASKREVHVATNLDLQAKQRLVLAKVLTGCVYVLV